MPRPRRHAHAASARLRGALGLGVALLLGGCGILPDPNARIPDCPDAGILAETGDLRRFQGEGIDLTGLVVEARILGATGQCRASRSDPRQIIVAMRVDVSALRGPALRGSQVRLPIFAVVANRQGEVLSKQLVPVDLAWGPNLSRARGATPEFEVTLPSGVPPGSLDLLVGFQLTEAELATNRRLAGR